MNFPIPMPDTSIHEQLIQTKKKYYTNPNLIGCQI